MGKLNTKISAPGSMKMPQGGRNPNVGEHGRGGALAKVKSASSSPTGVGSSAGSFTPVQKPVAGLANQRTGQKEVMPPGASARIQPKTKTPTVGNPVATNKPKRRGLGAAFFGEYT